MPPSTPSRSGDPGPSRPAAATAEPRPCDRRARAVDDQGDVVVGAEDAAVGAQQLGVGEDLVGQGGHGEAAAVDGRGRDEARDDALLGAQRVHHRIAGQDGLGPALLRDVVERRTLEDEARLDVAVARLVEGPAPGIRAAVGEDGAGSLDAVPARMAEAEPEIPVLIADLRVISADGLPGLVAHERRRSMAVAVGELDEVVRAGGVELVGLAAARTRGRPHRRIRRPDRRRGRRRSRPGTRARARRQRRGGARRAQRRPRSRCCARAPDDPRRTGAGLSRRATRRARRSRRWSRRRRR